LVIPSGARDLLEGVRDLRARSLAALGMTMHAEQR
jgi:hypothetical protein